MTEEKPGPAAQSFDDYIPPARKQLYFWILDTSTAVQFITTRMYFLDEHFPPPKLDAALKWLISHRIVGKEFCRWHREVCQGSDLEMHRHLLEVVDNEGLNPVIAGKNFKV